MDTENSILYYKRVPLPFERHWCGRAVGQSEVRSCGYQNSWMGRLPHLLGMGLRLRARRAPLLECALNIAFRNAHALAYN